MAKFSLEQLRSKVWPDEKQALRDLKASNVPRRGGDYELGEYAPGSWQLIPFSEGDGSDPAAAPASNREQRVVDALRRKPGAKPRGEAEVIAHAKAPAKKAAARKAANNTTPEPETRPLFDVPPSEPDQSSPPEPDTMPAPAAAAAGEPEPAKPRIDLTFIPTADGPFTLIIAAEHVTQSAAVSQALDVSRRTEVPISVHGPDGTLLRTIDYRLVRQARQADVKQARSGAARRGPIARGGDSKQSRAIALLIRPQGASADEINKVTDWPVGQRHINRLAKVSKRSIENLGDKKWRLIAPSS